MYCAVQLCLTTQLSLEGVRPDPLELHRHLRRGNPAPYAAFMRLSDSEAIVGYVWGSCVASVFAFSVRLCLQRYVPGNAQSLCGSKARLSRRNRWKLNQCLRCAQAAVGQALISHLSWSSHSSSPEKFLTVDQQGNVLSKPIKGTRRRGYVGYRSMSMSCCLCTVLWPRYGYILPWWTSGRDFGLAWPNAWGFQQPPLSQAHSGRGRDAAQGPCIRREGLRREPHGICAGLTATASLHTSLETSTVCLFHTEHETRILVFTRTRWSPFLGARIVAITSSLFRSENEKRAHILTYTRMPAFSSRADCGPDPQRPGHGVRGGQRAGTDAHACGDVRDCAPARHHSAGQTSP